MSKFMKDKPWTLCQSCRSGHVMEDTGGRTKVYCQEFYHSPLEIQRPIAKCSEYQERGKSTEHDMEKIAWVLENKKGRKAGFRPPKPEKE